MATLALTEFGQMVRKLRIDALMSMKQLAEAIGISSAYLSSIETGRKEVSPGLISKIVEEMQLDASVATNLQAAALRSNKNAALPIRFSKDLDDSSMVALAAFARKFNNVTEHDKAALMRLRELIEEMQSDSGR